MAKHSPLGRLTGLACRASALKFVLICTAFLLQNNTLIAQPIFETGPNWVSLGPDPIIPLGTALPSQNILAPPMSGRATVFAVNPNNRYNVWLGTAGGGLWVTNNLSIGDVSTAGDVKPDSGNFDRNWQPEWFPHNDGFPMLGIGAIVLEESSCDNNGCTAAYVGTGENSIRRHTYWGDGVYRVVLDTSGEFTLWSWQRLDTSEQFKYGTTAAMVLDGDELFVALSVGVTTTSTFATVRAPEPDAGFGVHRRSTSGNWEQVFETISGGNEDWDDLLLPTDLIKIPGTTDSFLLGVMNEGIFRTDDRGNTWCALNPASRLVTASSANSIDTEITNCSSGTGLPNAGTFDHVEIAAESNTHLFVVFGNCPSNVATGDLGATSLCGNSPFFYTSGDGGSSWTRPSKSDGSFVTGNHYSRYTHPLRAVGGGQVLWGGVSPYVLGTTSGLTQSGFGGDVHSDMHDLIGWGGWDNGNDVVYAATDGGFYFHTRSNNLWTAGNDSLITTQFVSIALDYEDEAGDMLPRTTAILGGLQDNSNAAFNGTAKWELWGAVGDGGEAAIQTPSITIDSTHRNNIRRIPGVNGNFSASMGGLKVNSSNKDSAFYSPFVQHEASKRVFVGTDVISVREGAPGSWSGATVPPATQISPVLGSTGHSNFQIESDRDIISTIAIAPSHQWRVYAGLYSGKIWRSTVNSSTQPDKDNSSHWTEVNTSGLPDSVVSSIAVHPMDHRQLWATFSDFLPNAVFYSDNEGATWTQRSNGIPANEPVNTIKVVSNAPAKLWAGTDRAVYLSEDAGVSWTAKVANLPKSPVLDIEVDHHNNRIFAATHGRGVWMLQDENPLLTVFEGWMEEGIWDIPIYGTGFTCTRAGGCECRIDVEREDGNVCASGTVDGAGNEVFVAQGGTTLRTENQGSCTACDGKPVAFGCLNGTCMGGASLASCNSGGHRVSAVKVFCEDNPVATGSIAGTCPEQSNPPGNLFEVMPGLTHADGANGGSGTNGGSGSNDDAANGASASMLLTPTVLASTPSGGDRAVCSALATFDSNSDTRQFDLRDALNDSASCQAAGVTASLLEEVILDGEDRPADPDRRLAVSVGDTVASQTVLGVAVAPGDAHNQCFNMSRLGIYLANQLAITQMRFPTGPGGAAGGELTVMENSPVGYCSMTVPTTAGQSGADIAAAIVDAFLEPGVPQPRSCPESNNPRDIVLDGDSVVAVLPTSAHVCIRDENVGFSFGPHGIPVDLPPVRYQHAAKFVCGPQKDPEDMRLARGFYASTINMHNPNADSVYLKKSIALAYPPAEQNQGKLLFLGSDILDPEHALKTDCMDIRQKLFPDGFPTPYVEGYVNVQSSMPLNVTGVYTTATLDEKTGGASQHSSIHMETVSARRIRGRKPPPPPMSEPHSALLCYEAKESGGRPTDVNLRTKISDHIGLKPRDMKLVCEPAYKSAKKDDLPDNPPPLFPLGCYTVKDRAADTRVRLTDHNKYYDDVATVASPQFYCPAAKEKLRQGRNESGLSPFPNDFLAYSIRAETLREPVAVFARDQFGAHSITFRRSMHLFEPTELLDKEQSTLSGNPHHCYAIEKSTRIDELAQIADQFGQHKVQFGRPVLFCDPADRQLLDMPVLK